MNRSLRGILAATGTAALAIAGIAAAPEASAPTLTVAGDSITVVGADATLDDIIVGMDPVGDSTLSGAGADYSHATVAFPSTGRIAISLHLGDANPGTGHIPMGAQFSVTPQIGSGTLELIATAGPTGLVFASQTCEASTGANTCTSSPVDGSYADGALTWELATSALPGAQINIGSSEVFASVSAGVGTLTSGTSYDTMGLAAFARIPSATLTVDGEVVTGTRLATNGFSVSTSGLAAGEHTASVELCNGATDFTGNATECTTFDLGSFTIEGAAS